MLIYGPSLSLHCHCGSYSSVSLLRLVQTQRSNCHNNGIDNASSSSSFPCPCPNNLTRSRRGICICICITKNKSVKLKSCLSRACRSYSLGLALTGFLSATMAIASVATADAIRETQQPETLSNIPQTLSGVCTSAKDCKKAKIQRPKSRKAESCTSKCVTTCIRGGEGSPGEGPLNVRRPLVVFKQGFRTRQYCLVECSDVCNLISDGEDGP